MDEQKLNKIKSLFEEKNLSLYVLGKREQQLTGNGILPLFKLISEEDLKGAFVMDKVVGKAAAALLIVGHVQEVHTPLISTPARKLLEGNNVKVSFDNEVENILNRANDGICPMELLTKDCLTAEECFQKIEEKLSHSHLLQSSSCSTNK